MSLEGLPHIVGKGQQTEPELGELSVERGSLRRKTIPLAGFHRADVQIPQGTQLTDEIGGTDVLERFLTLPPLSETLSLTDEKEIRRLLQERYERLGNATLHPQSILRLREEFKKYLPGKNFTSYLLEPHNSTFKAEDKDVLLGLEGHVQKSVTLKTQSGKYLILTSVGDFWITDTIKREIAERHKEELGLSHRELKNSTINPKDLPAEDFGLRKGMLSPFLSPGFEKNVYAFIHLAWAPVWNKKDFAGISMSPFETLKIPLDRYRKIVEGYFEGREVRLVFL